MVKCEWRLRVNMSGDYDRDGSGEFSETITDDEVLLVFEFADGVLSAAEIAEPLPLTRQAVRYRLNKMADEGLVGKKKLGARAVGWWAEIAPPPSEAVVDELAASEGELERGETVSHEEMKRRLGMNG
jgi:hypothetical protein